MASQMKINEIKWRKVDMIDQTSNKSHALDL